MGFVGYQFVLLVRWAGTLVGGCLGKALVGGLAVCVAGEWLEVRVGWLVAWVRE